MADVMSILLWSLLVADEFVDAHPFVWVGIWIFVLANIFLTWMWLRIIKLSYEPFGGLEFWQSRHKQITRLMRLHRRSRETVSEGPG
jgi:hypothetical protein